MLEFVSGAPLLPVASTSNLSSWTTQSRCEQHWAGDLGWMPSPEGERRGKRACSRGCLNYYCDGW